MGWIRRHDSYSVERLVCSAAARSSWTSKYEELRQRRPQGGMVASMGALQKISQWFRQATSSVEDEVEGGTAVATPPPGAESTERGDADRETSTNAQVAGAADQPWPGNR